MLTATLVAGTFQGVQYPRRGGALTFSIRNIKRFIIWLILVKAALKMQHALKLLKAFSCQIFLLLGVVSGNIKTD